MINIQYEKMRIFAERDKTVHFTRSEIPWSHPPPRRWHLCDSTPMGLGRQSMGGLSGICRNFANKATCAC